MRVCISVVVHVLCCILVFIYATKPPVFIHATKLPMQENAIPKSCCTSMNYGGNASNGIIAGWKRRLFQPSTATRNAVQAAARWLAAKPATKPPATWTIHHPKQVAADSYKRIAGASGLSKWVFSAATTAHRVPVIVKIEKVMHNKNNWFKQSASPGTRWTSEFANEVLYLEHLRGQPGVPLLLGGWHNGSQRAIVTANPHAAGVIARGKGFEGDPTNLTKSYRTLADKRPLEMARAILGCFRTFSERGGFHSFDFTSRQFVVAKKPDGGVTFDLVDGPMPIAGPIARMAREGGLGVLRSRSSHATSMRGFGGYPVEPVRRCTRHSDCKPTLAQQCCCHAHPKCLPVEGKGAPEARGMCEARDPRRPNATRYCVPISDLTHVYDAATKWWLLPLLASQSAAVAEILPLMRSVRPESRLSFSDAFARLEQPSPR